MAGTPFTYTSGTATTGSSATFTVSTATAAGDALAVAATSAGTGFPSVTSVTDTQGNSYTLKQSFTSAGPGFWVYAATGPTKALSISDSITVNFSGTLVSGTAVIATDCPGVTVIDVSVLATGTSTAVSVSGTPVQSGETALALFGWANGGGVGSMAAPFTQLTQQHLVATSGGYCTTGYDLNPAAGVSLTASDTITSAAWRAVLLTFKVPVAPVQQYRTPPRRKPSRAVWQGLAVPPQIPQVPRQQPYLPLRRKPSRAYVWFTPVTTVNAAPPPPVSGTVQPQATVPVPRRKPSRAVIQFQPVATVNAAPAAGGAPALAPDMESRLIRRYRHMLHRHGIDWEPEVSMMAAPVAFEVPPGWPGTWPVELTAPELEPEPELVQSPSALTPKWRPVYTRPPKVVRARHVPRDAMMPVWHKTT